MFNTGLGADPSLGGMMYSTKTAIVLVDDLEAWQKVNVAAFLAGGLAHRHPDMIGEAYRDADGRSYAALIREPVFVLGSDAATIRRTYDRALSRDLVPAIFTRGLFQTTNDIDNRASVAMTPSASLDLVGLGLHGDRKVVDKVINGLKRLA